LYVFPDAKQDRRDVESSVPSIRHLSRGKCYYIVKYDFYVYFTRCVQIILRLIYVVMFFTQYPACNISSSSSSSSSSTDRSNLSCLMMKMMMMMMMMMMRWWLLLTAQVLHILYISLCCVC